MLIPIREVLTGQITNHIIEKSLTGVVLYCDCDDVGVGFVTEKGSKREHPFLRGNFCFEKGDLVEYDIAEIILQAATSHVAVNVRLIEKLRNNS